MITTQTIISLAVGICIGAMDFSLARSTARIRPTNIRAAQAVMVGGFIFRLGAIGVLLWTMSRANNISIVAVCIGLTVTFTVLALGHAIKVYAGRIRIQNPMSK